LSKIKAAIVPADKDVPPADEPGFSTLRLRPWTFDREAQLRSSPPAGDAVRPENRDQPKLRALPARGEVGVAGIVKKGHPQIRRQVFGWNLRILPVPSRRFIFQNKLVMPANRLVIPAIQ
jgi:hypothetical protein